MPADPVASGTRAAEAALDLLAAARDLVVLTGAGVSTDSGIPDYRGPGSPNRRPMAYQEFVSGPEAQRRYWARSHLGWGRMRRALPNPGHDALARLAPGLLITQNVDGLHEQAGSHPVVALHGRISRVVCLQCRRTSSRSALQERLEALNPGFGERHRRAVSRPDGDVEIDDTADFVLAACTDCAGALKPDVVFFGENVPPERVLRCYDAVDALAPTDDDPPGAPRGALLVAGSSLTVMSGLRFVRRAVKLGVPVVIVNRGETRGDPLATLTVDAGCSEFLTTLLDRTAAPAA